MDSFILGDDIPVMYITAAGFPEGVPSAHQQLHDLLPKAERRRYFGISEHGGSPFEVGDAILDLADPEGYCLEWYIGDGDVKCMVRSADESYPKEP